MVGKSGAVSEDKASIALLRLATTRNNKQAWFALEYCFRQKLILWLRQHPRSKEALGLQSEQEYVTQAFAHFRHLAVSKQMEFRSLHAALRYLAACLNSVVLDMLRSIKQASQNVQPSRADLWLAISQILNEERERRLAYLLFHCGLKPAEVVERCPEEFQNLAEVQSLHVRILNHMIATSLI
ncbi:hypothetical protein [Ktedonospora formicarum]|nr:hypothetical protein [Ktedonospora formicarum]